jgi:uncharacterized protein (DUF1684 family)
MKHQQILPLATALGILIVLAGCGRKTDPAYVAEVDQWHATRLERLSSETGWLTLVGLHPLADGRNVIGSGPEAGVRMIDKAPALVGEIVVTSGKAALLVDPDCEVLVVGREDEGAVSSLILATDLLGPPTVLACRSLVFYVIDRNGQLFLRVKDREAATLQNFTGIERFPVDARWRITARLEGEPGTVEVPDVLGNRSPSSTPGVLVFRLDGKEYRLTPTGEPGSPMFLVFGDATNGPATYPGGRFLTVDAPAADGTVTIDFNRAYNPPCVFTAYATCPLPSAGNTLPVAVEAGERKWGQDH